MLARPFSFSHVDYDVIERLPPFRRRSNPIRRDRIIHVIGMDAEHITYQVFQRGRNTNASPARVKAETFRRVFAASMAEQADSIKEQING